VPRLSETAERIRASVFAELAPRVEERRRRGGDLVPLHIGDTWRSPPEAARFDRVLADASDGDLYAYGPIGGDAALLDALVARLRRLGWAREDVGRGHVLVGGGATHALFCAARAVLDPGDEVLVFAPYWPLTVGVIRTAGGVPVEVPLQPDDVGGALARALAARVGPRTRAIYLITPNNPDGRVIGPAELSAIAQVAVANDLWVFADEVYADYVYVGAHGSMARVQGMAERTISAYSLSKSHALAGARVGYVVAPAQVIELARRVATHSLFNVPVIAQRAAARAAAEGDAWVSEARACYLRARDAVLAALPPNDLCETRPAAGGSYVFVDFAALLRGRPLRTLLEGCIDRGVMLAPGGACGEGYETCARLCFTAAPEDRVLAGVARLREAMSDLA
jgi:aspartate/methionine/tyrosine aminotransferase